MLLLKRELYHIGDELELVDSLQVGSRSCGSCGRYVKARVVTYTQTHTVTQTRIHTHSLVWLNESMAVESTHK